MTRVCFVTRDFLGPVKNGGIGTAFTNLARLLKGAGHEVTVLYTPEDAEEHTAAHWAEHYAKEGIAFEALSAPEGLMLRNGEAVRQAYLAYLWLKARDGQFDIVHFHDWHGLGAYATLAKKQGIAFAETRLCVQLHAQALWHVRHSGIALDRYALLESDALERISIEHADVVTSPSRYMLEWTRAQGTLLPEDVRVMQNVMPETTTVGEKVPVKEIVFFGRLEYRKGLDVFCEALRRLPEAARLPVTFLGKEGTIQGKPAREFIAEKLQGTASFQILSTFSSEVAQDYLKGEGRLAVIASRAENSPYTVLECLANGTPFLASDTGGTAELIAEADRARVLFVPTPPALAEKLAAAKEARAAAPAVAFEATRKAWEKFHAVQPPALRAASAEPPHISVCIAHRNRPELLKRALDSLKAQSYTGYEVIVADDGSDDPAALALLKELEQDFAARGWTLIRQENRYAGAARNTAAKAARGEWLLFMDDDNIAAREEMEVFARATQSGADIYTCVQEFLPEGEGKRTLFVPLGGAAAAGMYENSFGDVNALVRREAFEKLGGFTEDFGVGLEDMEFFAKATLEGIRIEVVPEPLFRYRGSTEGVQGSTPREASLQRALTPYLKRYPAIAPALMLAQGIHARLPKMHENYAGMEAGFREVSQANAELKIARAELEQDRARLKAILDAMGEDAVRFVQRMQGRQGMRKLLAAEMRFMNLIADMIDRFRK